MRVMALDIGDARVGVAVSDPLAQVATPLKVVSLVDVLGKGKSFTDLLYDWEPELLVCGLPFSLSGEEGKQAKKIKECAFRIGSLYDLPIEFCDERLSSKEAKNSLAEMGVAQAHMKGKLDMIAASIFLQTWLDEQANKQASKQDGL